ncbi:MAG TPA: hypothetical protein VLU95_05915 [Candidatus Acidoferrum sp.]|nr:hypothetical protein [Candidatus Acidoferrum sp.]
MRELTKTEILYIMSLIVSFVFIILSISMLMGNGTNVVAPYAALFTAIVLSSSTLVVGVAKTRKTILPQMAQIETKPVVPMVQVPYVAMAVEKPVVTVANPPKDEPVVPKVASNYGEAKIEPIDQLITLPMENEKIPENSITQTATETKTETPKATKQYKAASVKINTVKPIASKKPASRRAKSKARKTK